MTILTIEMRNVEDQLKNLKTAKWKQFWVKKRKNISRINQIWHEKPFQRIWEPWKSSICRKMSSTWILLWDNKSKYRSHQNSYRKRFRRLVVLITHVTNTPDLDPSDFSLFASYFHTWDTYFLSNSLLLTKM